MDNSIITVTRHLGTVEWLGADPARAIPHLHSVEDLPAGCVVVGVLPLHLAVEVVQSGRCYVALSLDLPPDMRGRELSRSDMDALHADGRVSLRELCLQHRYLGCGWKKARTRMPTPEAGVEQEFRLGFEPRRVEDLHTLRPPRTLFDIFGD